MPQFDKDTVESTYCRLAGGNLAFEKIELIMRDQQYIYSFETSIVLKSESIYISFAPLVKETPKNA